MCVCLARLLYIFSTYSAEWLACRESHKVMLPRPQPLAMQRPKAPPLCIGSAASVVSVSSTARALTGSSRCQSVACSGGVPRTFRDPDRAFRQRPGASREPFRTPGRRSILGQVQQRPGALLGALLNLLSSLPHHCPFFLKPPHDSMICALVYASPLPFLLRPPRSSIYISCYQAHLPAQSVSRQSPQDYLSLVGATRGKVSVDRKGPGGIAMALRRAQLLLRRNARSLLPLVRVPPESHCAVDSSTQQHCAGGQTAGQLHRGLTQLTSLGGQRSGLEHAPRRSHMCRQPRPHTQPRCPSSSTAGAVTSSLCLRLASQSRMTPHSQPVASQAGPHSLGVSWSARQRTGSACGSVRYATAPPSACSSHSFAVPS